MAWKSIEQFKVLPTPPTIRMVLTGQRFGKLTVIGYGGKRHRGKTPPQTWICRCDCGNIRRVDAGNLRAGFSKSCGCVHLTKNLDAKSYQPEYLAWHGLKGRCLNPANPCYRHYGGRGIQVCQRWLDSFDDFVADMGLRPSDKHSIDRKDNDGNYEPSNCRWATSKEQSQNRRNNVRLTHQGITICASEWARRLGISPQRIEQRIKQGGTASEILRPRGARTLFALKPGPKPKVEPATA